MGSTTSERLSLLLTASCVAFAASWLLPNHYYPWAAFDSDWLAAAGFAVIAPAGLLLKEAQQWPRIAVFCAMLATIPLTQWSAGQILFFGDAGIATLYLLGLTGTILCGYWMTQRLGARRLLTIFWSCVLLSAVLSEIIELRQWLGQTSSWLEVDLRAGSLPFGNLAQHSQLATLLVWGLVATLILRQRQLFSRNTVLVLGLFLAAGVVATQSRAGALELVALLIMCLAVRQRTGLRIEVPVLVVIVVCFVTLTLVWPLLCDALLLNGRSLQDQAQGGMRIIHWQTLMDAIGKQPWFGYGWNQVSVAQAVAANSHPASGEMIEHSHNLLLDLLVWNGVPLGLFITVVLFGWLGLRLRTCLDGNKALLLMAVVTVLIHSLVEFPLEYAYFLLPFGFIVGAIEALTPGIRVLSVSRVLTGSLMVLGIAGLVVVTIEYPQAEENQRSLRFESAHIGFSSVSNESPELPFLTQLDAFLRFARSEARPGMSREQLDEMQKIARRFGYAPVLFRYALASALNDRPQDADEALKRLCKTQVRDRCVEAAQNWEAMSQDRYPALKGVKFPFTSSVAPLSSNQ